MKRAADFSLVGNADIAMKDLREPQATAETPAGSRKIGRCRRGGLLPWPFPITCPAVPQPPRFAQTTGFCPAQQCVSPDAVAPSRGRGSKPLPILESVDLDMSLPHGGVDRNCAPLHLRSPNTMSLPHGGVDRNILLGTVGEPEIVAPSRGRGSKPWPAPAAPPPRSSLPHGGVDRNAFKTAATWAKRVAPSRGRGSKRDQWAADAGTYRRSLTGAWIETFGPGRNPRWIGTSLPHGGVDRNCASGPHGVLGAESLPHGGVDRNYFKINDLSNTSRRSLTGAWIETAGW